MNTRLKVRRLGANVGNVTRDLTFDLRVKQAIDSLERVCYNDNKARCHGQDLTAALFAGISVYAHIGIRCTAALLGKASAHAMQIGGRINFAGQSIVIFALMGVALFLFPYLVEFSLPGGIAFKLRSELEEVQDIQLTGEVIFNKDEKVRHLFWIDSDGKKHLLLDKDTASLFATQKGFVGISKDRFSKIESGPTMACT